MSNRSILKCVFYGTVCKEKTLKEKKSTKNEHDSLTSGNKINGSARGVMVIVGGNGHGDTISNPGLIAFHIALIPLGKV